jgi:ArsR family transcriptional regulator
MTQHKPTNITIEWLLDALLDEPSRIEAMSESDLDSALAILKVDPNQIRLPPAFGQHADTDEPQDDGCDDLQTQADRLLDRLQKCDIDNLEEAELDAALETLGIDISAIPDIRLDAENQPEKPELNTVLSPPEVDKVVANATQGDSIATALAALGHGLRFEVWRMLRPHGALGLSAGVIAARLAVAPSSLSFHLQQMTRGRVLVQRRSGRQISYAVNEEIIATLGASLQLAAAGPVVGVYQNARVVANATQGDSIATALAALGHGLRLEVWRMLRPHGALGLSAGVIATRLAVSPVSLSFHLQQMARGRVLVQRRSGRQISYAVNEEIIATLGASLQLAAAGPVVGVYQLGVVLSEIGLAYDFE